jgi:hypothetical protein
MLLFGGAVKLVNNVCQRSLPGHSPSEFRIVYIAAVQLPDLIHNLFVPVREILSKPVFKDFGD